MTFLAAPIAGLVARPLAALGVSAGILAVGVGLGIGFEHRPPMGFPFNLIGQGLATQRNAALTKIGEITTDRDAWKRQAAVADRARQLAEQRRADEFDRGKAALAAAEAGCAERVRLARLSAERGHAAVTKPPKIDPASHCPIPEPITAAELRGIIWP